MTNKKTYFKNAFETTLTAELSSVGTVMTVADATGLTDPLYLVIEPDSPTQREYVEVTNISGLNLTVTRYLTDSAAGSGLTHPSGSIVRLVPTRQAFEDLHDRVGAHAHTGATDDGVQLDHGALSGLTDDDHTQYLKEKASSGLASEIPEHTHASAAEAGQFDHGNAAGLTDDDHTQYLKEKASGGAASEVPEHTHASAAEGGQFDHGAAAGLTDDDHTQYLQKATLTTKGDLYVATGAGAVTRLPVGTDGQLVSADSGQAGGVAWIDPSEGGLLPTVWVTPSNEWIPTSLLRDSDDLDTAASIPGATIYYVPLVVPRTLNIDQLGVHGYTSDTDNVKLGLYDAGSDGLPNSRLENPTQLSGVGVGWNAAAITSRQLVGGNLYWVAILGDATISLMAISTTINVGWPGWTWGASPAVYRTITEAKSYAAGMPATATPVRNTGSQSPLLGVQVV